MHTHTHCMYTQSYMTWYIHVLKNALLMHTNLNYNTLYAVELPTLEELLILKYTDNGEKKKLRIINEACHMWKDITNLICDDANLTSVLEDKCRGDHRECLKRTFIDNFINKKPKNYSQDWNGLIELLDDIGLETLVENVKHGLSCYY